MSYSVCIPRVCPCRFVFSKLTIPINLHVHCRDCFMKVVIPIHVFVAMLCCYAGP